MSGIPSADCFIVRSELMTQNWLNLRRRLAMEICRGESAALACQRVSESMQRFRGTSQPIISIDLLASIAGQVLSEERSKF